MPYGVTGLLGVERTSSVLMREEGVVVFLSHETEDPIPLRDEKLGQVRAVLPRNPRDNGAVPPTFASDHPSSPRGTGPALATRKNSSRILAAYRSHRMFASTNRLPSTWSRFQRRGFSRRASTAAAI